MSSPHREQNYLGVYICICAYIPWIWGPSSFLPLNPVLAPLARSGLPSHPALLGRCFRQPEGLAEKWGNWTVRRKWVVTGGPEADRGRKGHFRETDQPEWEDKGDTRVGQGLPLPLLPHSVGHNKGKSWLMNTLHPKSCLNIQQNSHDNIQRGSKSIPILHS